MRKEREALLGAALAGLLIVGAAAFVIQPALVGKPSPDSRIQLSQSAPLDALTLQVSKTA